VGGLHKRNGVRRLAELGDLPHVRAVVIGAGPQLGWLHDNLPHAKFLEPMSTGDLGTAMASLDVLVHPGRRLTCAHSLRAAGASGIPTVGPRSRGALEVIRDGRTGVVYDASAADALASALTQLTDPTLRARLGAAARRHATERSWTPAVTELVEVHFRAAMASRPLTQLAS
jgi:phosphatidylinositol alpha 1,6-mannosyltransferase